MSTTSNVIATLSSNKSHQTAVFIRRTLTDSESYVERVATLVKSFNRPPNTSDGGTIKVDIYTVIGGEVKAGNQTPVQPVPYASLALRQQAKEAGFELVAKPVTAVKGRIDSPTLRAAAKKAGYNMPVIVDDGNA